MIVRKRINGVVLFLCVSVIAFCSLCVSPVYGDPVLGDKFTLEQPDGKKVDVRIWGDEFYRVVESLDGYTLTRDPSTGEICYARLSPDGNTLVSTGVRVDSTSGGALGLEPHIRINSEASRAIIQEKRRRASESEHEMLVGMSLSPDLVDPPSSGNVKGICLIVDFDDEVWTIDAAEIDDYCNQVGYSGYSNNGSVRDYFYDVSDGNLTYTNFVPTAYYRALLPKSYYDDCGAPYGERTRELIVEALTDLENNGFDFSQYDSNGDGLIDAINCFYAGVTGCGWANGLWPHSWTVNFSADGVSAYKYQITGLGSSLRLSTFCHENGHMICFWPDLYDYDVGVDDSNGVGKFCIMCSSTSSTNPQEPCAYLKYLSGWTTTTLLTTPHTEATLPSDSNTIYKHEHPTLANEYYLFENRQKTGRDSGLPDDGLAIWHIDTDGDNDNQEMTPELHYEATLVQADGNWDLENDVNNGDATDLWADPGYVECTPVTNPNTDWWDGSSSQMYIANISTSSSMMSFIFNPSCRVEPLSLDFGNVAVGDSLDRTFTIYNVGPDPLVGTVTEACSTYSVVSGENYNIASGDSQIVTVRFAPTGTGTNDCTVQTGSSYCGDVFCTGFAFVRECIVEPDTVDFGSVVVGQIEFRSFTITNDGDDVLSGGMSATCDHFVITSDPYYVLYTGESKVMTVAFFPGSVGPDTCLIDTGFEFCKDVLCIGMGSDPPACFIEPDTLDFGAVYVGDYMDTTFIITNVGGDTLTGTLSEACDHYDIGDGAYNIAAGETLTVTVRFEPTADGPFVCTIDTGSLCDSVWCIGTGIDPNPPVCFVDPDTLDFGAVYVGDYMDTTFIITNVGGDTLTGTLSEACEHYDIGDGAYSVASGETLTVTVRFEPTADGPFTCTIDTGSLCDSVWCFGSGIDTIPPPPPEGVNVTYNTGSGNQLTWDPSSAPDFESFKIYRSDNPALLIDPPVDTSWQEVHETSELNWLDVTPDGWRYLYEITALDSLGNESGPNSPDLVTGMPEMGVPMQFALYQSAPNPFNPSTVITYDVPPGGGKVTISVFDVAGRLVKTLVNENKTVGRKTVRWDGRTDRGDYVATGVFFYRMQAPGYEKTMKMTLLK